VSGGMQPDLLAADCENCRTEAGAFRSMEWRMSRTVPGFSTARQSGLAPRHGFCCAMAGLGKPIFCPAFLVLLFTVMSLVASFGMASGDALTEGERLRTTLEVRDAQSGFAGWSGTVTRIEPDGTFTVSRFLNDRIEEPHRQGRLDKDARSDLADALSQYDFLALPEELGQSPPINPRTITVSVGDRTSTLFLEPTVAATDIEVPPDSPEARLLGIVQTVETLTEDD
jgi:hypothetical protein